MVVADRLSHVVGETMLQVFDTVTAREANDKELISAHVRKLHSLRLLFPLRKPLGVSTLDCKYPVSPPRSGLKDL